MKEIYICCGDSIEDAVRLMGEYFREHGEPCYCEFNGKVLYSTDTLEEAYVKVTGITKTEYDEKQRKRKEEYEREEREFKERIPILTKEYCERARGLVMEEKLGYWDRIVPIRLGDLYHGMELEQVLEYCAIMRRDGVSYDERLRECYDKFMSSGHSGMSAGLTAGMIREFCPNGEDLSDAVMNFRFEKNGESE